MKSNSILKAYMTLYPEYGKILYKSDQRKNLHDPLYLLCNGYIDNTPLMRIFAKDVIFCRYSFQEISSDNYLVSDGTDYDKLKHILLFEYGLEVDIEQYFRCHRLYRLMQYVEKNVSEDSRKAVLDREKKEKELGKQLFQLLCDCCDGRKPRLLSNPAFIDIDFKKFGEILYRRYTMLFSPYERRQLNTVEKIILHLIFRFRDGGQIHNKQNRLFNQKNYEKDCNNHQCHDNCVGIL